MIKRKCPHCGSEDLREVEIRYYYHEILSWDTCYPEDGELDETIDSTSNFDCLYCAECFNEFPYGLLKIEEEE